MRIQNVGYEALRGRYPGLFVSYCLDEGRAGKFFARRYRDEQGLLEGARRAAEKGIEKPVLAAVEAYNVACGAPRETLAAIAKLGRGAAVVVTGQQPSAGWGPLYNFYKAQAAIKYAQGIEGRGIPCVAVFWNHSDDTQAGAAASFPDRENRVHEVSLANGAVSGALVYEAGAADALQLYGAALAAALPQTAFSPWMASFCREGHRNNVAESFTRMLLRTLGPFGLIVLEPRHLEGERAAKFYAGHLAQPERFSKAVEAGRRAVVAEGFEDQLGRDVGLDLFEVLDGKRTRVISPGAAKGRLSAGVALRPLLQDAVLPSCAYVAGPSEVGYQATLRQAYDAFGVDPPVVFPRVTATLLEPKIAKVMEKFGLKASEIFGDTDALVPALEGADGDVPTQLGGLPARVMEQVESITKALPENEAVGKAKERTRERLVEAFGALADRVKEELTRLDATDRGQLAKLGTHVRPGGKLQERVFTPLYYFSLFGPGLPAKLLGTLDPFIFSHQVVTVS